MCHLAHLQLLQRLRVGRYTHTQTHTQYVYACMYVYTYVCIYTCTRARTHTHTHTYHIIIIIIHTYDTYIHTYMHTHTDRHTRTHRAHGCAVRRSRSTPAAPRHAWHWFDAAVPETLRKSARARGSVTRCSACSAVAAPARASAAAPALVFVLVFSLALELSYHSRICITIIDTDIGTPL